jgi:hypothetical protein
MPMKILLPAMAAVVVALFYLAAERGHPGAGSAAAPGQGAAREPGGGPAASSHPAPPAARAVSAVRRAPALPSDEPDKAPGLPDPPDPPDAAALRAQIARSFEAEPRDPHWSPEMERSIEEAMARTLPTGSSIRRIDCRSSLCRVESQHDSNAAYQAFLERLLLSPEGRLRHGGVLVGPVDDRAPGALVGLLYLAREGHPLGPSVPAMP